MNFPVVLVNSSALISEGKFSAFCVISAVLGLCRQRVREDPYSVLFERYDNLREGIF